MAKVPVAVEGSDLPRKRQKLNSSSLQLSISNISDPEPSQSTDAPVSSFKFTNCPPSGSQHEYILDITKYIPAGCLRIQRSDCGISSEAWNLCKSWSAFAHPRDVYNDHGGEYLPNALQETLLNSPILRPYLVLHNSAWIRMEFQTKDQDSGHVRVYILPDDVGNAELDRKKSVPRRAMQLLLGQLDIAGTTWNGQWSRDTPVAHVDSSLDGTEKDSPSLFYLFNTLPSPQPDPEIVQDENARAAMHKILDSDIEGLTTTMYPYQRKTAAMMLQREAQPSRIIDPRLRQIIDQQGVIWYCDLNASLCLKEPRTYDSPRGGICAETMGLGKTLICLSLILATKELSSQIPVEYSCDTIPVRKTTGSLRDMAAATIGRTGTPWKSHFDRLKAAGYEYSQCIDAIRRGAGHYIIPDTVPRRDPRKPILPLLRKVWLSTATLVVVPPNLVRQWELEIKKHTFGLKVLVMKKSRNKEPLPPAKELAEYDIILFSKQRFDQEAADGRDNLGRCMPNVCQCPFFGDSRKRPCTCFKKVDAYQSPLKDLHIKRLITDEGHAFGNASRSARTEAVTVVEFLQLTSRWIVSGTPTSGLYGAEISLSNSEDSSESATPVCDESQGGFFKSLVAVSESDATPQSSIDQELAFYKQERKDLEKLGNIATIYLRARPWCNTYQDGDTASWSQHVMQPRHGSKSHGNMDCLRATLGGMIIRHRPEDVEKDVMLPPLHQTLTYVDGSIQDKLSLNIFALQVIINAVTSERKDVDYFFHPRQRKALNLLVSNLRQASFHWSGYAMKEILTTIEVAKKFLENREVPVSTDDEILLQEAIKYGEIIIANSIKKINSHWHEMPMYVRNEFAGDVRAAWALDGESTDPTLMGATMVHAVQKFVANQSYKSDPMDGLVEAGEQALKAANLAANPPLTSRPPKRSRQKSKSNRKAGQPAPTLAGGVTVSSDSISPKKRSRAATASADSMIVADGELELLQDDNVPAKVEDEFMQNQVDRQLLGIVKPKSAMKQSKKADVAGMLDPSSPLVSASIVSTSSAKLSYLMDQIGIHHQVEKILIFYESDNIAYYVAQALECLNIKHLIYAKSLPSDRKAQYVVTFNHTETFRVLLMDISQAAFGLDMSSASRVYFVNPVFSPQVEAQAVKRAHRIGQTKPVFVETLVLKGSIEEVILDRRKRMTNEEHSKCKSILDDETMYDWIRNVRFLPVPTEDISGPDQMAALQTPQHLFARGSESEDRVVHDPDADLILDDASPNSKGKRKVKVAFAEADSATDSWDSPPEQESDSEARAAEIMAVAGSSGSVNGLETQVPRAAMDHPVDFLRTTRGSRAGPIEEVPSPQSVRVLGGRRNVARSVSIYRVRLADESTAGDLVSDADVISRNPLQNTNDILPQSPRTIHDLTTLAAIRNQTRNQAQIQDQARSESDENSDDLIDVLGDLERFENATSQRPQFSSGYAYSPNSPSDPSPENDNVG